MRSVLMAVLVALGVCCGVTQADAFTILVTEPDTPSVPNSIIELAQRLGYFKRAGVRVDLVRVSGTPLAVAALAAGDGDLANVSLSSLLRVSAYGKSPFRAIAAPSRSMSYVVAARNSIASVSALAGTRFGIGQVGTLDDTLTRTVLKREEVDPAKLRKVVAGSPRARLAALAAHKIDATTVSYATWMELPEKTDLHVILDKEHYLAAAPVIPKVNVMRPDAEPEIRSEAVKVTAALIAIARDLARDPARWVQAMNSARPDVPKQILRSLGSSYARDWCVDGCFGRRALERSAAVLVGPAAAPVADWADFSVLKDALSQLDRQASQ